MQVSGFLFYLTPEILFDKIKTMPPIFKNKPFLILIILFLVILVAVFVIKSSGSNNISQVKTEFQPSNTDNKKVVTRDPKMHADNTEQFRIEYGKIRTLLPYENSGVRLQYNEDLGFMTARIKDVKTESEFLSKKLTMENFLKTKGIVDLCGLAITWIPPQDLTIPVKDSLSPNCTF